MIDIPPINLTLGDSRLRPVKNLDALKEQTDNFEAIILKQMLDTAMPEENPLFKDGAGSKIYRSMYHEELSKTAAGGFGYSELLFDFLKEKM